MNLYDEAIKDFDILVGGEELKEIIEYPPSGNWHNLYVNVKKALEHAKKEHELLGLYREYYGHIPYSNSPRIKYCEEKIDELEKELEELE